MRLFAVLALLLLVLRGPAQAGLDTGELDGVSAAPAPGAALPMSLGFVDQDGRAITPAAALGGVPGVVIFADYTCRTLCGPILDFAVAGLAKTGLRPGIDYRLIVIGIDPKDGLDAARAMRKAHFAAGDPIGPATAFLTGSASAINTATAALGYHYRYDPQHDQFAHPAALYVTDARGRVTRLLSGLGLDGADLRLALVEAGRGAVGTFADHIRLLCYGYDPVRGVYTERITIVLGFAAGATFILMLAGILGMLALERRKAPS